MIIALDYGEKRIGVAVTDDSERFVNAIEYISNKSERKKVFAKEFRNSTENEIHELRRKERIEAKIEFKKLCNKILYLCNLYYPNKFLIGLPSQVDEVTGEPIIGAQGKKIQKFVKKLDSCLKQNKMLIKIEFIEESLSSKQAEENLRAQGFSRDRIRERIDSESARILLEEYLNTNCSKTQI